MAAASGCAVTASSDPANWSARAAVLSSTPGGDATATTRQRPWVMVPVLSAQSRSTAASCSSAMADLTRTPRFAAPPREATTTMGAASTNAHGHARTSITSATRTETAQPTAIAQSKTKGVKISAKRPMRSWVFVDVACASSTNLANSDAPSSDRAAVASTLTKPWVATVPRETDDPLSFSTGSDSPVSADSSTAAFPKSTTPSTGTRSPARTTTTSPFFRAAASTVEPSGLVAASAPSPAVASWSAFRTRRRHSASATFARHATTQTVAASAASPSWRAPATATSMRTLTSRRPAEAARAASRASGSAPSATTTSSAGRPPTARPAEKSATKNATKPISTRSGGSPAASCFSAAAWTDAPSLTPFSASQSAADEIVDVRCLTYATRPTTLTLTSTTPARPSNVFRASVASDSQHMLAMRSFVRATSVAPASTSPEASRSGVFSLIFFCC
mmetsp:Transcript_10760/g.33146  ORF Transcript_10760/g.33146 Transcript_10760/m.33146 type:complete len:450 (+) Transcript_10760:313-1662(+)